jgi:hypothetical protein
MATYITASEIVQSTLINEGDNGMHKYQQRLEWVLRGIKKLNYDTIQSVKTVFVPVNDNHTIDLPLDCITWTRVGIKKGDKIYDLSQKRDGANPIDNYPNGNPKPDTHTYSYYPYLNYFGFGYTGNFINYRFPDGQNVGRLFGYGGGHNQIGYFKEWKERNQLILFNVKKKHKEIYLEYITNGMSPTGETLVDSRAEDFLILWCEYQDRMYKKDPMFQHFKSVAYNELRLLQQRMTPFTIRDLQDSLRKSFKLAPKY